MDLRPPAVGVHQAGVRCSRRLGVHRGRAEGSTAIPAKLLSFLLLPIAIVRLVLEPDFGQTMLVAVVWTALFFFAGLHWFWVVAVGGMGMAGRIRRVKLSAQCMNACCAFSIPIRPTASSTPFRWTRRCRAFSTAAGSDGARAKASTSGSSRRPHRFRVRGGRRGIRHGRVHGADRLFRLHRPARANPRGAQPRPVLPRSRRPGSPSCSRCKA